MTQNNQFISTNVSLSLLVVSNNQILRQQLCLILKDSNFNTQSFNQPESLPLLGQHPAAIIILDILKQGDPDWHFFEQIYLIAIKRHHSIILVQNCPFPTDIYHVIDDYIDLNQLETSELQLKIALQISRHTRYLEQTQTIKRLKQARETQLNLAEMASHDLRHPMTNIRISEVMLRELTLDDHNKPFLDSLLLSINNMEMMFDDFMSAMLLGERILKLGAVDLQTCVDHVYLQYLVSASNKNILLEQGQLNYLIYGDMNATEQIINNLVSNAIKYSFFDSRIYVTAEVDCDDILFQVIDYGQGIKPDERSVLFTRFGRVSSRPTNNEPTVGLGLWIVRQLTERMGGEVGAYFPDEGGSVFWVKLPHYQGV